MACSHQHHSPLFEGGLFLRSIDLHDRTGLSCHRAQLLDEASFVFCSAHLCLILTYVSAPLHQRASPPYFLACPGAVVTCVAETSCIVFGLVWIVGDAAVVLFRHARLCRSSLHLDAYHFQCLDIFPCLLPCIVARCLSVCYSAR